jgi:site-specific recombinase XerD
MGAGAHVNCRYKGRKDRCTPLTDHTRQTITAWLAERHAPFGTAPLFCTRAGTPLSRDAVARLVATHAARAALTSPAMQGKTITPHTLRHTAAMTCTPASISPSSRSGSDTKAPARPGSTSTRTWL